MSAKCYLLTLIPQTPLASEAPSDVTSDAGIQGHHVGSVLRTAEQGLLIFQNSDTKKLIGETCIRVALGFPRSKVNLGCISEVSGAHTKPD